MAFLPSYGTGFGFPQYATFAPTAFASAAPQQQQAEQHEGEQHSQAGVSTSDAGAVFYGQPFIGQPFAGQTIIAGAQPFYGAQSTVIPSTGLVPIGAPLVRRPGYNERLVAWRNRQKAFNRYKKAAKAAIKNASKAQFAAPAYYGAATGFAAPTVFGAAPSIYGAAPFGASYFGGYPIAFDQGFAAAQAAPAEHQEAYGTFGDFSQASQNHQEAAEEPEIRGTQV